MDNKTSGLSSASGSVMRLKFWNEITSEEKIERTREQLKQFMRRMENVEDMAYKTKDAVTIHKHADGKVVLPIEGSNVIDGRSSGSSLNNRIGDKNGDEVYF